MACRSPVPDKAYRDWPVSHFIELCRRIRAEQPRAHFLIFGGSLEVNVPGTACRAAGVLDPLAGRLTLRQTAA